MKTRAALKAATVLAGIVGAASFAAPFAAQAQPVSGLYVGAGGGANFIQHEMLRGLRLNGTQLGFNGSNVDMDTGFVALGSVGWGFGNGFRAEVEGSYRQNDINSFRSSGSAVLNGQEQKYGAMVNVLFDLDIGSPYVFPYFGAGIGWQQSRWSNVQTFDAVQNRALHINASDDSFAYQGILGASFPIPGVVGLSATAEYRFLGLLDDRDYKTQYFGPNFVAGPKLKVASDYNHSLMLGVRYAFNVAPPPPPAVAPAPQVAPAPAPARTYLVFFDWDRADLTARARQIIAEAAQASTRVAYTQIEVDGHADKSGTPQYNQRLSLRRAQNVAAELVRDGVPRQAINIQAFGESRPLVPTADGVREPQNRRVEIIIH